MNRAAPPKKERRLWRTALRKLTLEADYYVSTLLTSVFGKPFWFWAQRRGGLWDQLHNEGFWQ